MTFDEVLQTKEDVFFLDGVSKEQIESAEQSLSLSFSEDYKECLEKYLLLTYDGHELTGICDSPRLSVVETTKREKEDNEFISDDMYLIEKVGVENMTIWQNSNGEIFEVEYKCEPRKICESLLEYIDRY